MACRRLWTYMWTEKKKNAFGDHQRWSGSGIRSFIVDHYLPSHIESTYVYETFYFEQFKLCKLNCFSRIIIMYIKDNIFGKYVWHSASLDVSVWHLVVEKCDEEFTIRVSMENNQTRLLCQGSKFQKVGTIAFYHHHHHHHKSSKSEDNCQLARQIVPTTTNTHAYIHLDYVGGYIA